jgi:hypothetical protein
MKWAARSALPPIPAHAVVTRASVDAAERSFAHALDLEERIDEAFARFDEEQPALARYLVDEFEAQRDETAQALGYFLSVCIHEAFRRAFGERLGPVDEAGVELAVASLELDESMRQSDSAEPLESDDVVAMLQPHVMAFVREQIDSVLAPEEDEQTDDVERDVDVDCVSAVYHALLVCILALSRAVRAPSGQSDARRMLS